MIAPKAMLRDCLQITDTSGLGTMVELPCRMDCARCGFHRPVAEERQARIRAGEWSINKNGKRYLYVGETRE